MLMGIAVIIYSLLYSVMVYIVYVSKKKLNNMENRIYSLLLRINILGLILELGCNLFLYYSDVSNIFSVLNVIVNKTFLIYLLSWELLFAMYIFLISFFGEESPHKNMRAKKRMLLIMAGVYIISSLLILILPTYYFNDGNFVYSYGMSTDMIMIIGGLCIIFELFCLAKNIKKINKKKYFPLFVLMILVIFLVILREINPGITIINSVFAFITVLMYFTIENPDVQMLGEIYKAKEYAENSNNEKSLFLFKVTQRLREPLKDINRLSKEALMESNIDNIKESLREIKFSSNTSLALVNDVLDISELENRKITIGNHKYQPANLFGGLARVTKLQLKEKAIELRFNYDQSIPEYLSGDSLRIKQIVSTLLENATVHTDSGFIEFNINAVVKYDMCRLIIVVEDSGKGMTADQLNHIFDKTKIDAYENHDIDDSQKNLVFIKTLVDLIGGTVTVTSEIEKGTKFIVVIDQKIPTEKKTEVTKAVKQYENIYVNQDHVLVVTSDEKIEKKLSTLFKKFHVNYDIVRNGQECLEKIRNKESYQLILMDETLPKLSSVHTFDKLRTIDGFDIPVVLMTKHKDIETKDTYINIGFYDTIGVPITKEEIKQILDKYIKMK